MANTHITESEIQRALEALNLNGGTGPDGLFPKTLKTLSPYIAPSLSRIFKISLQTSQISDDWRHAIATPVANTPRTADPKRFRPMSLTSVVCKALEAILKDKMPAILSHFSLLTSRQHGFLPIRSALTKLLMAEELVTYWLDEGSPVDMIYLDISKDFYSVNHWLLLDKLKGYGIGSIVISCIECFLNRRTFQVNANGTGRLN